MTPPSIVLCQMPSCWGLPNPSPFCLKVETWLRMVGLPYTVKTIDCPPRSSSGKVPYLERPDGSLLCDSSVILETLAHEHDVHLDAGLSDEARAQGLLVQRLFEEALYFFVLHDRWVDDDGWRQVKQAYFGKYPWFVRVVVAPLLRRKVVAAGHGQGVSRLPAAWREAKVEADLRAFACLLGNKPYLLDRPSSYDAVAYAFLANVLFCPVPHPAQVVAQGLPVLSSYCERMRETYWSEWEPGETVNPGAIVQYPARAVQVSAT